eukprot:1659088-Karenia_brevis.AAC.1
MLPAAFQHDPETNRLSLKPDMPAPWVRPKHSRQKDTINTWLYCCDCKAKHVLDSGVNQKH